MLGAMVVDPRCLVAVIEFEDVRYVQYWVGPEATSIAEVISNLNIGDAVALSPHDEEKLRQAGWSEPSPGPTPNWRFEAHGRRRSDDGSVAMSRDAVYDVLRERDANPVSVRIWEGDYRESASDEAAERAARSSPSAPCVTSNGVSTSADQRSFDASAVPTIDWAMETR